MGFLDGLLKKVKNDVDRAANSAINGAINKTVSNAINGAVGAVTGKGRNHDEKFTFSAVPTSLDELKALPEAKLDTAFKTTALVMLALMNYENDKDSTIAMLDFLMGPDDVSTYAKGFLDEKIGTQFYKVKSFFAGATPQNDYAPTQPLTITVSENPYSFDEENWATMWVHSSGADNPRPIKLRKKPSTGQWFMTEIQCMSDIRVPVSEDKWA